MIAWPTGQLLERINAASKDAAFFFVAFQRRWQGVTMREVLAKQAGGMHALPLGLKKFAQFMRIAACAARKPGS